MVLFFCSVTTRTLSRLFRIQLFFSIMSHRKKVLLKVIILGDSGFVLS
jgi:hypothetical protein